jgi:hypothetical protein
VASSRRPRAGIGRPGNDARRSSNRVSANGIRATVAELNVGVVPYSHSGRVTAVGRPLVSIE